MTTQTVQPNEDTPRDLRAGSTNPILRWLRGKIAETFKFAFHHPIEAVLLAFLLWITLTGLTEANWAAVPQNGIAQTVIAGEQQAFQEKVGVHVPTLTDWTNRLITNVIGVTSSIAAAFMTQLMSRSMQDWNYLQHPAPATISPGK